MKLQVGVDIGSYTFNAAARTVTLSGIGAFTLEQVLLITNVTDNVVIYQFNNPALGATLAGTTLTLTYNTTTMSDTDRLQILVNVDTLGQQVSAQSQSVVIASDQMRVTNPNSNTSALPVRAVPLDIFRTTFARVLASTVDSEFFSVIRLGTGMAVSQSAGNLVITSGITANSETILRSTESFNNEMIVKWQTILSQRIANNNFIVEMVDVIGDGLALTVNSTTSITITIPSNPFTSENVGQALIIGAINGVTAPGQRAAIASVSGNNVNFTVTGFPASGSGTCSLFGWNYHQVIYTGTVATNMTYDAQRKGWNSGATTLTINTTATVGHMGILQSADGVSTVLDQLVASAATFQTTTRGSRVVNLPDETANLFLQFRVLNGTVAPASTTTWTVGMACVENIVSQPVAITNAKAQSLNTPMPVQVNNTPAVTVSSGTVTTVTTLTGGPAAEDAATTSSPHIMGGIVRTATVPTTIIAGDAARLTMTLGAAAVMFPYAVPDTHASANLSLTSTTAQPLRVAGTAGIRNYLVGLQAYNSSASPVDVIILDGVTEIWRQTLNATSGRDFVFHLPLRGTAATALNVNLSSAVTAVRVTAQTFQAA